ncbi:MAG TPA: hypothetical protein VLV89_05705 [Candidatus Acidoferrum sp.]|nr:hypothetical protein [Candidatus Acidoferrum sp.]
MENPARIVVMLGLLLCFAVLGQGYLNAQTTGPATNVQTIWDLIDVKIGNTTTTINTTTSTDNNGMLVLPPNAINLVPTRTSTYYCRDGKMIAVENQGQKPKDVNCGGWIPMGDYRIGGGYGLGLNYGQNGGFTITEHHTTTGMGGGTTGGGSHTTNFPRYEVFGGFSYFGEPFSNPTESGITNYVGFSGSFTYNPCKHLGIVGEFSGLYQTGVETPGIGETVESTTLYPYMFGAQLNYRKPRFDVFGQALFGGVYARNTITFDGSMGLVSTTTTSNGFGMKIGGGLDWNITPHISARVGQVSYFLTDFGGSVGNNFMYQGGIVYKF